MKNKIKGGSNYTGSNRGSSKNSGHLRKSRKFGKSLKSLKFGKSRKYKLENNLEIDIIDEKYKKISQELEIVFSLKKIFDRTIKQAIEKSYNEGIEFASAHEKEEKIVNEIKVLIKEQKNNGKINNETSEKLLKDLKDLLTNKRENESLIKSLIEANKLLIQIKMNDSEDRQIIDQIQIIEKIKKDLKISHILINETTDLLSRDVLDKKDIITKNMLKLDIALSLEISKMEEFEIAKAKVELLKMVMLP